MNLILTWFVHFFVRSFVWCVVYIANQNPICTRSTTTKLYFVCVFQRVRTLSQSNRIRSFVHCNKYFFIKTDRANERRTQFAFCKYALSSDRPICDLVFFFFQLEFLLVRRHFHLRFTYTHPIDFLDTSHWIVFFFGWKTIGIQHANSHFLTFGRAVVALFAPFASSIICRELIVIMHTKQIRLIADGMGVVCAHTVPADDSECTEPSANFVLNYFRRWIDFIR